MINKIFSELTPKTVSKLIAIGLAFTLTFLGSKCFGFFVTETNDQSPESVESEPDITVDTAEPSDVLDTGSATEIGSQINADSGALYCIGSKKVIAKKKIENVIGAGELVTFAAALVISQAIDNEEMSGEEYAVCPASAARISGYELSKEVLTIGKKMRISDLLKCMIYQRGSAYVYTIAIHLCGSEEAFVSRMNDTVRELGVKNTVFSSVCGEDYKAGRTTVYDTLIIIEAFLEEKRLAKIFTSNEYVVIDSAVLESVYLVVKNDFFENRCTEGQYKNDGIIGGKVGFNGYRGWSCILINKDGNEYISISCDSDDAFADSLITYAAFA